MSLKSLRVYDSGLPVGRHRTHMYECYKELQVEIQMMKSINEVAWVKAKWGTERQRTD